jgi:asparagine synthetase B (glutamine-hydrolysing)
VCGIFAYTGQGAPDRELLTAITRAAATRGPHAHGWTDGDVTYHALGPMDPAAAAEGCQDAVRCLGHARLATFGKYDDIDAVQPISVSDHHVAFNGNIYNPTDVYPGEWPADTHHLAHAYATARAAGQGPGEALARALAPARMSAWAVVVLDACGALVAFRSGLPLFTHQADGGLYLASRRFHPDAEAVPEKTLTLWEPK